MSLYKIIFTGPVGAGKTTAIASISDIEPFQTEELASDETSKMKANTTVAMDYGLMRLEDGECIHLYGTPGQERFDFMWDILTEDGIGLILLLNNINPDPLKDLEVYLSAFQEFITDTGIAVGVTRMNEIRKPTLDDYAKVLEQYNLHCPIFEVDARSPEDIIMLTSSLMYSIDPGLH